MSSSAPRSASRGAEGAESLKDALQQTLDEARMVLPGIQALFGFQLIAVFNAAFAERLSAHEQLLHLVAILCVTVAVALVMTPAAYHRQIDPRRATTAFLTLASRFISAAMLPLAAGLALDIYIVARLIVGAGAPSAGIGGAAFAVCIGLWFVYPRWRAARML